METVAFIDIFTTQNDLYGKNNCPIQFCCDIHSEDEIYDNESMIHPKKRKHFNIIADEPITMSGFLNSGFKTEDMTTEEYHGYPLNESLEVIYKILSKLKETDAYIIGYNHISYDLRILNTNFKRILGKEEITFKAERIIDVMDIAENVISVVEIGNYTMDSVFLYLFGDWKKLEHIRTKKSTETDILITKLLFKKMLSIMSENKMTMKEIYDINEMNRSKINMLNFGKYKGCQIDDVFELDSQYMNWLMNNKNMQESKPYLIENIRKMFNTKVV